MQCIGHYFVCAAQATKICRRLDCIETAAKTLRAPGTKNRQGAPLLQKQATSLKNENVLTDDMPAQGNVGKTRSASYGERFGSSQKPKSFHFQLPQLLRLITLVTLINMQTFIAIDWIRTPHANEKYNDFVTFFSKYFKEILFSDSRIS
jgi:hypothetical protein